MPTKGEYTLSATSIGAHWKTFGTIGAGTSTYGVRNSNSEDCDRDRFMHVIVQAAT